MPRECKGGWVSTYVDYTKPQQSPTIFHVWTALSTIASCLGRRVWMDRGYYTLYPNLYTILISASGVGMKTTAIKIGTEGFLAKIPNLTIMRGSLTIKFLVDWMTQAANKSPLKNAEVTIFCEEFKVFAKGLYADSGLIENLTKLYDCGIWEYSTGGSGVFKVERPCINMIAASTPEWLTTGSASDFIGGGFSSRIVPVALLKDEKLIAWPEKTLVVKELEGKLISDLIRISSLGGEFFVTQDAKQYFEKWYLNKSKYEKPDARMKGWYSKKHDLVLKVAMLLAVALGDDLVITDDHIESSLSLLGKLELNIPFAYQGVAWGEQAKFQDRVLNKIREMGKNGISHSDLMQSFHHCMTGTELKSIIQTLHDEDVIRHEPISTKGKTKIIYFYKGDQNGNS